MKKMTLEILENFSSINQGILITEGNKLRTISVMRDVYAEALVPDTFVKEFAIYDLNEFLSTLSLFDAPEVTYNEKWIGVQSGRSKIKYYYSQPQMIVSPKDGTIKPIEDSAITFKLSGKDLKELLKAASVMKLKSLEISPNGLRVFNKTGNGNQYDLMPDSFVANGDLTVALKIDNIKLIDTDYDVTLNERCVHFTASNDGAEVIRYVLGVDTDESDD